MQEAPPLLIISEKEDYLKSVEKTLKNASMQVLWARSFHDALESIEEHNTSHSVIFLDPMIDDGKGVDLIKKCHQHQTGVGIYLILENLAELGGGVTADKIGVTGLVQSSKEISEVVKVIDRNFKSLDQDKIIKMNQAIKEPETPEELLQTLVPIKAANFLSGSKSFFDVFVKLREDKVVKVLDAGDCFDSERLDNYLKKGLEYFYIKKEAQKFYLDFCDTLTKKIIKSKKFSTSVKVGQTLNMGQEVSSFLKLNGLDEEAIEYAENYASSVADLVRSVGKKNDTLSAFLKNLALFDHCAGAALVSGLLARKLGFDSTEAIEILGLAATLHDIGLYKKGDLYEDQNEDEREFLDEEDIENQLSNVNLAASRRRVLEDIYLNHPLRGADIVSEIEDINPLVPQLIAQHHERRDHSGFPGKVKADMIHQYSQVIGVADEFTKLIKRIRQGKAEQVDLLNFPSLLDGFSGPIRRAWISSFLKK